MDTGRHYAAIQEFTHGYVGYHLNNTYICCPKCDEICDNEVKESIPVVKQAADTLPDDLPF